MLDLDGGIRDEVEDTGRRYTCAGTVDAVTREIGVPGDTWIREEMDHVGP